MQKSIPNLFTLLNLVFGCLAIISILQNGISIQYNPEGAFYIDIPEKIWMASLYIGIAALVDFLDGFVARLFNASSALGKQLDSLADLVSFGVAPALIVYQFLRLSFAREENGIDINMAWLLPSLLIAVAAAYRLGRFNLDVSQQVGFEGVPVPAAGLLIASFPLIYWNTSAEWINNLLLNKWFLYSFIFIISWLMVSRLPLIALKFNNFSFKSNQSKYLLIALSLVTIILLKWLALPVIFVLYILISLASKKTT